MQVKFEAAFPPIQSAIKVDGLDDVVRLQLDGHGVDLNALKQFKSKKFRVIFTDERGENQV